MRYGALRIVILYVIVSLLWITFSDRLLYYFDSYFSHQQVLLISSCKGYLFVLVTGIFLYYFIKSDDRLLKNSELQYRNMYESNPNPMWIYDAETLKIASVNDAAIASYGFSKDEFLSKTILDIRPAEDAQKVIASSKHLSNDLNRSGAWRHLKKDGTLIYVIITSHKIIFNNQPHVLIMARDMTDQVLFEKKLEQVNLDLEKERGKLKETQLISKIGGWEFLPAVNKLTWSEEVYRITGIAPDDSRPAFDIYLEHIYPQDRERMIKGLHELVTTGKQLDVTHRIIGIDGDTRYIRQLARIDKHSTSEVTVIGSMQDITELKMMEAERNKYQFSLESTLNNISDAFFSLDNEMNITSFNPLFEQISGWQGRQITGKSIFDLFPIQQNALYPFYQKALRERIIVKAEEYSPILKKWIRLAAYPTDDGVAVYFADISESKAKDIQLKEAVERYELVARATKDVIYDWDMVNDHIIYNTSISQLIDVQRVGHTLQWWRSLIHPDDVAEVVASQQKIRSEGKTNWECEYRVNTGNGEYKYVVDQGYFVFDAQKQPVRLIGAIKDIDDLKRSNQENKRLADIITRVNNMIVVTDANNQVRWVNRAFTDLTGYTPDEVSRKLPAEFLCGTDDGGRQINDMISRQGQREAFATDLVICTKQKVKVYISAELTPAYDEQNQYIGYVAVYQNITSRREKEEEIKRQNEFLREVAWLSSHEIRRPVATMLGLMNLLDLAQTEEERQEIFPKLSESVNQMDDIVHLIHKKIDNAVML
ncbi:PAS domain S-box protein [Mucilaginibacter flavus]|uniref:PAS domain S-box protein n=1 Tax=Mucilaginibacter flavus TaxID=931504 RepID=UPI0025B4B12A|nr:PAS domain S-box protein [Mucilaginibacter flavus]MDN3581494.1 PAS domain S-box protein [Mucilaginibacter flavus]